MTHITQEQIRAAGGIIHRDGNIFFTNIDQLNAALAQPASEPAAPEFVRVARAKLDSLLSEGYKISGYSIERNDTEGTTRGFVTAGGLVGWWTPESAPAAVSGWMPIESAPKDGMEILLGHPDGSLAVAYWNGTGFVEGDFNCDWATHWKPKPAAPTGEPG